MPKSLSRRVFALHRASGPEIGAGACLSPRRITRLPTRRTVALVGEASACARVVLHLRTARPRLARPRIARFDASPLSLSLLLDAVRAGRVAEVVAVAPDAEAEGRLREVLGGLDLAVSLTVSPLDGVRPEARLFGVLPVRALARRPIPAAGRAAKEAMDRGIAALLLLLLAPLMLAVAATLRIEGSGPVLLRQWREGHNGRAFALVRFRTPEAAEVSPLAWLLRRAGVAAWPQLINVARGEMSLVGPPPHAVAMRVAGRPCAELAPHYPWRHRVKPGLTGLAQMAGLRAAPANADDLRARLALDLAYIGSWSVWLDCKLLLRAPWRGRR